MIYIKPILKSYTADGILEELGPGQTNYTATLNTKTGEVGGDVDACIYYEEGSYTVNFNGEDSGDIIAVLVGVEENEYISRGFVGFDISSIQSTVVSARLKIFQGAPDEEDPPYINTGNLVVDHVNFGDSLTEDDFDRVPLQGSFGTLSTDIEKVWKPDPTGLDVTQYVQDDINSGRSYSQFRLHFTAEGGAGVEGYTSFCDSEGNFGGHTPVLEITYY